ncbi:MAG: ankyrin repeat domain-containing protein, partial [Candidatus Chromulinivorax sp.]|nr:ankyrin repeat domain-containing protein [Candidatus Chromulinivorax sp.]
RTMNKIMLVLLTLCCAIQTMCSTENIEPKSDDSEYRERIGQIAKSCSSEHFNISHKDRIPAQHGIPTLHEIAFKKLEPAITEVIHDLIFNKYDDERDKQNKRNYIDRVAHYDSYLLLSKFINAPTNDFNTRLLHTASLANNPEITQYLLDTGALPNQQNNAGETPLYYAAINNSDKVIPLLITAGALVNLQSNSGDTPLHYTAYQNADKVIPLLITDGALVNQQNNCGDTPLHYAIWRNADKAIPLLIDAGADITIQNQNIKTPRMNTNNPATLQIFDQAVATRPLKQKYATKIQALGRGFIARKNK